MKNILTATLLFCSIVCFPQVQDTSWKKVYRATPIKINDLVHTKLDVSFDYSKSWMYGKELVTLHPHFYPTDSLNLDAKSMNIKEVSVVKAGKHIPLKYSYDSLNLRITLDKTYRRGENYTLFIDYIAMPNNIKRGGSIAIEGAKGLYFINPDGKEKDKPIQIWTQGETESNSGWFPTIDKPDQKTTDEINMTVPDIYKTLSNGLLVSSKKLPNGMRTDTWKMDLPHAPYLMMMAVGDFSVIKDSYKGKEVSYFVEKKYAPVARRIFGYTPEMIAFYSRITGVDYPWQKYDQIAVRDYISGAMENTTATLHGEIVEQDARQLIDGNVWEDGIAHELFHQWFGDYVTTESWSNITLNESFADLSETLWETYKHGKDAGDEHNYNAMLTYLRSNSNNKNLVRFYYPDREAVFDAVSYQKGGRILNMLRYYVGDSAFFKSLNLYLTTHKFGTAEAQDLRLAFEAVTGKDLNWYWNQWYYGSGQPKLDISYNYDADGKNAKVIIKQSNKIFKMPLAIDVYTGSDKKRYNVWIEHPVDSFSFRVVSKPELINVDGDKILLCEKTDHKTLDNFIFQYKNAGLYVDRREAIEYALGKQSGDPKALDFLKTALNDKYFGLRLLVLQRLDLKKDTVRKAFESMIFDMAKNDPKTLVRAGAIEALGKNKNDSYRSFFLKSISDSSYAVSGKALTALAAIDSSAALNEARKLANQNITKGELANAMTFVLFNYAGENDFDTLATRFDALPLSNEKFMMLQPFSNYLKRVKDPVKFRKGIDVIVKFRDDIPGPIRRQVDGFINGMVLNSIAMSKQSAGLTDQADYVKSKLPAKTPTPKAAEVPAETLQKYAGDYDNNGVSVSVALKNNNLNIIIGQNPSMDLVPISNTKFSIKFMEGYTVEFITNTNGDVTEMVLSSPGGQQRMPRKK